MSPRILLHGTGAIGAIYVYLLQKAGCNVTAVCRSNYDAVKSDGFVIDSGVYGKGIHVKPDHVVRTPTEAANLFSNPFDYVVVSTKALPDARTAKAIAPAVTKDHTAIVLIQNGIGIEDEYQQTFPENLIISCVVYLPATQTSPGRIDMGDMEQLEVGTFPAAAYDNGGKQATDRFIEALKKRGSNVELYADIQEQRWNKLLINASWNPICALTLSRDVAYLDSSPVAEKFVREVMMEVVAICKALGYKSITAELAERQLSRATARKGGKGIEPSMLVDLLWQRRMEVEVILGNPARTAQSLGVAVPRLEALYALSRALDEAVALRRPGMSLAGDELKAAQEKA